MYQRAGSAGHQIRRAKRSRFSQPRTRFAVIPFYRHSKTPGAKSECSGKFRPSDVHAGSGFAIFDETKSARSVSKPWRKPVSATVTVRSDTPGVEVFPGSIAVALSRGNYDSQLSGVFLIAAWVLSAILIGTMRFRRADVPTA